VEEDAELEEAGDGAALVEVGTEVPREPLVVAEGGVSLNGI